MITRPLGPYGREFRVLISNLRDSQIKAIDDCIDEVNGEIDSADRPKTSYETIHYFYHIRLSDKLKGIVSDLYLREGWESASWNGRMFTLTRQKEPA